MVHVRLRRPDDRQPLIPAEIRYFQSYYPAYLERRRRQAERLAENERRRVEARESVRRVEAHKRLMKDIREWGRENGFFVGTRGRIPRRVIEAYNEAKGLT